MRKTPIKPFDISKRYNEHRKVATNTNAQSAGVAIWEWLKFSKLNKEERDQALQVAQYRLEGLQ